MKLIKKITKCIKHLYDDLLFGKYDARNGYPVNFNRFRQMTSFASGYYVCVNTETAKEETVVTFNSYHRTPASHGSSTWTIKRLDRLPPIFHIKDSILYTHDSVNKKMEYFI